MASALGDAAGNSVGFLLAMGYSTQRGFGGNHPFAGEIRLGTVAVEFEPEELGFPIEIAEVEVTEQGLNPGSRREAIRADAAPTFDYLVGAGAREQAA